MVIVSCHCDWGLGKGSLPPHQHIVRQRIVARDGRYDNWGTGVVSVVGADITDEVEELLIHVDWKQLAREAMA